MRHSTARSRASAAAAERPGRVLISSIPAGNAWPRSGLARMTALTSDIAPGPKPRGTDNPLLFPVPLSVRKTSIRLFEAANRAFRIERAFQQGFRVPLAPMRGIEEITAIYMNGTG